MHPVLRTILSMVAGYVVMAAALMAIFTVAYLGLGADWSFKPDSWEPSARWIALSLITGGVVAFAGGTVTQLLDRSGKGALALMGLILVLGILTAVLTLTGGAPASSLRTTASPGNMEAMQNAIQPMWLFFVNPLVGLIGVFAATKLVRRRHG